MRIPAIVIAQSGHRERRFWASRLLSERSDARVSAGMGAVSCHAQGLAKHELARIRADYPEAG